MEESVHFKIPEYEHSAEKKGKNWIIGFITITISLSLALVIFENYLLALIVFMGFSILIFLSIRPPELIDLEIGKRGIKIAGTMYLYSSIRAYSLNEKEKRLVFLLQDKVLPLRVAHLGDVSEDDLAKTKDFLERTGVPEADLREPITHKIADLLGF